MSYHSRLAAGPMARAPAAQSLTGDQSGSSGATPGASRAVNPQPPASGLPSSPNCGRHSAAIGRRTLLKLAGVGGVSWLTPLAHVLARQAETNSRRPAQSLILLWLDGGPSQLETLDPHSGTHIAAGTRAIETRVPGVRLAAGYERLAEQMESVTLIRSMKSKEGDHERGVYLAKTGYRPDPTVVHPAIGAICCEQLPAQSALSSAATDIPRHVSILPGAWPSRGGYLGAQYDAFKTYDPQHKVPDVVATVEDRRFARRFEEDLDVVERAFARGRSGRVEATLHRHTMRAARQMMSSEQLAAFDVMQEPAALLAAYGDTPFGRGCLAARRLIEVGVRCVEVTLGGWDSHINNHEIHRELATTLDPALATLIRDLRERELLEHTLVVCAGEFGRTPRVNPLGGRDHWPHAFSIALSGGGIRGGHVVGETDPDGGREVVDPHTFADVHATLLSALGIDPALEIITPIGRPLRLAEGQPIRELVDGR